MPARPRLPLLRARERRLRSSPVREQFKIPTLWGVKDTAPYFHNNGAKTLRDAVAHYKRFFNFTEAQDPVGSQSLGGLITLTDDDVDDIVAYLQLLGSNRMDK